MTSVLIVVAPQDYDGLGFITLDVILKENAIDIVNVSIENSTARGDDQSSVMTVSFAQVLERINDFSGAFIVGGQGTDILKDNGNLQNILKQLHNEKKLIASFDQANTIIEQLGLSGDNIHLGTGNYESFAENAHNLLT